MTSLKKHMEMIVFDLRDNAKESNMMLPYSTTTKWQVGTREEAVTLYEAWVRGQHHPINALHELKRRALERCCKHNACKGDVFSDA